MTDLPLLLTREQASSLLGVSPSTFSNWVAAGTMPEPIAGTKRWSRVQLERAAAGLPWTPDAPGTLEPADEPLTWAAWEASKPERTKNGPLFNLSKRQEYALRYLVEHDFSDGRGVRGASDKTFDDLVANELAKKVPGGWRVTAQGQAEIIRIDTARGI